MYLKTTAKSIFNQLHPDRIIVVDLTIFPDIQRMKVVWSGSFQEEIEGERILELKEFIQDLENPTLIDARNDSIITTIYGKIQIRSRR